MQNTHESVHFDATYWWGILENFVATQGNQGDEWKQQRPEHQLEWIQYLANDLLTLKQQVEQRQNLARLYFVPTFVNHSLDFDIHWPEEKQQRDDAYLVYKRYPMLLFAVESIQCDHDKGMAEQVQMQALSIIAESAVCEWPVEMWKDGQKFYWDRQRLYLCKKESATKSSVTYQIRFLALVHSKELSYKESLHKATAHHFLEDLGKDIQNLQANHGKGQPISRSIGYILYQDKEAKAPAAKRSKMTASRVENEEINIEYEIDEMAVIITCIPENKAGSSKLWTRMGDDATYEHFTIQFGTGPRTSIGMDSISSIQWIQ
ncbi:unnamed protein product, partial [Mesorhabditis belari]|uniref:Uncharacterized protein n=1 Tax=Mesorhabditis belari TaxID=2138241 RepID=A0AAF3F1T5_9BILA